MPEVRTTDELTRLIESSFDQVERGFTTRTAPNGRNFQTLTNGVVQREGEPIVWAQTLTEAFEQFVRNWDEYRRWCAGTLYWRSTPEIVKHSGQFAITCRLAVGR